MLTRRGFHGGSHLHKTLRVFHGELLGQIDLWILGDCSLELFQYTGIEPCSFGLASGSSVPRVEGLFFPHLTRRQFRVLTINDSDEKKSE